MKSILRIAPLMLVLVLTGCASYGRWSKKVGAFSTNTAPALNRASAALNAANAVHTLQEETVLANQYAERGYRPGELTAFMSQSDLAARKQAIDALTNYATLVGDLALGKRVQAETTRAKVLSAAKATTSAAPSSKTKSLTQQQMNYALSGLDIVFKAQIEHKVRKKLPVIMAKADPSVQQICSLLEADMETLRSQEKADYITLLMQQNEFIRQDGGSMGAVEKQAQIMKLFQIEQDAATADADLMKAEKALKQVAEAHHALVVGGVK